MLICRLSNNSVGSAVPIRGLRVMPRLGYQGRVPSCVSEPEPAAWIQEQPNAGRGRSPASVSPLENCVIRQRLNVRAAANTNR